MAWSKVHDRNQHFHSMRPWRSHLEFFRCLIIAKDLETFENGSAVDKESGSQVCSEPVLANARCRVRPAFQMIFIEPGLNHVPAKNTLEPDQATDLEYPKLGATRKISARKEVARRDQEKNPNEPSPHTVGPFEEKDPFKFLQAHAVVEAEKR